MRVQMREEKGLVYSIQAASQPARSVPGTGLFYAAAPTDPAKADALEKLLRSMMLEFAAKGPSAEELEVARTQARKALERAIENPGFWVGQLVQLRYRGGSLAELHDAVTAYDDFSVEDLQKVAARYLTEAREVTVVAVPKAKAGK
ncbi:MAG: insulinase family protein [bacterium]|nr:insulinase family protein [bacterium]